MDADTYTRICWSAIVCSSFRLVEVPIPLLQAFILFVRPFLFLKYIWKEGVCSQPTSILKWLLVILPNYRNKLHAVNLFCMFVSCVVLMCRLITLTHDPVFYVPCGGVPSSPYRRRRVLCTGIELLLWAESISTLTDILIPMKTTFAAPKGKDVWRPELEPTSCLDGNSEWAQWGTETCFLCYPSISMQALVNKRQVWRNKN